MGPVLSSRKREPLSESEIHELLARNCWGVLSMVSGQEPYAVPIIYGWDGTQFVFANGPGRKVDVLKANPEVCLVVAEVEGYGQNWKSVVVRGRIEWVEGTIDRIAAFNLLRKQIPFTAQRVSDASKIASAPVARIIPTEITGRMAGN